MRNKKMISSIISLLSLVALLSSTAVFAAEVPKSQYTLTVQKAGTVKEKVNFPDYEIDGQEFEMILVPTGSEITFAPSVTMVAMVVGIDDVDGVFQDTYDGIPWIIDGSMDLITEVQGGKTATGRFGSYPYYMFTIYDNDDNVTRMFFKTVAAGSEGNSGSNTDSPDGWASAEVEKAISLDLVPEHLQNHYKENITRGDFCNLVINMLEVGTGKLAEELISDKGIAQSGNPFTDTAEDFILQANALGIVNGKGNGIFDPNGSITRQEAAVMLTNAAKVLDQAVNSAETAYADAASIAAWAKPSVSFVSSAGVMNGTGNNSFSPLGTYSRQQAFMTIVRLFEAVK